MWAAVKSPLLLGNDLRVMDAKTLSIVNNPAIIALSQDPMGEPAVRVYRNESVPKDEYGIGETHVWSGRLDLGDQVVILLNAANEDLHMEVSLNEIFVRDGPGGSAPQVSQDWHVYDLWANRMADSDAQTILDAETDVARSAVFKRLNWYNSTETPYSDGLQQVDARLLGEKVSTVKAGGKLESFVPRHSAQVFRLRSASGKATKRKASVKDKEIKDEL
jgi:alpha-galactosidase